MKKRIMYKPNKLTNNEPTYLNNKKTIFIYFPKNVQN